MLQAGNSGMMPTLRSTGEGVDGQTRQRVAQRGHPDAGAPLHPDLYPSSVWFPGANLHARRNRHAGYQLVAAETYTWTTFASSSALLVLGGLIGWLQSRYHHYLLETVPGVFAARMRTAVQRTQREDKPEPVIPPIEHRRRLLIPMGYLAGVALVLGGSLWA